MSTGEQSSAQTYRELLDQTRTPLEHAETYDGSGTWKPEYMPTSGEHSLADHEATVSQITLLGDVSVSSQFDYPHTA